MIGISEIKTTLNRAAWLIACMSIAVLVVIVRDYARSRLEIGLLREAVASGQKSIDAATKREAARDSVLQQKLREIEALKRKVQTPAQIIAALPAALPQLPLPITVSRFEALNIQDSGTNHSAPLSTADSPNSARSDVSSETSGAVLSVPDADLKPLYDDLEDCRAATATAEALKRDLADTQQQLSEMTAERDIAMRNTSPTNRWQDIKRAAKWFAVGAALGMLFSRKP